MAAEPAPDARGRRDTTKTGRARNSSKLHADLDLIPEALMRTTVRCANGEFGRNRGPNMTWVQLSEASASADVLMCRCADLFPRAPESEANTTTACRCADILS